MTMTSEFEGVPISHIIDMRHKLTALIKAFLGRSRRAPKVARKPSNPARTRASGFAYCQARRLSQSAQCLPAQARRLPRQTRRELGSAAASFEPFGSARGE